VHVGKDGHDSARLASWQFGAPRVGIEVIEQQLVQVIAEKIDPRQQFAFGGSGGGGGARHGTSKTLKRL
jgi:hypothetical protein